MIYAPYGFTASDEMDDQEVARSVGELIRKEVGDWDDEVVMSARFKAFSGQRPDWEPRYFFWRDLIINLARHLRLFIIRPSLVKNVWFNRGGLTPLCLDHVLLEMYSAGDVLCSGDLVDPKSGQLTQIFRKVLHLVGLSRSSIPVDFTDDHLIISSLLREKTDEVVKVLSDNYWTSSCIITMKKFQEICGGPKEASAILSYLSECRKVKYLAINKKDVIEGVKVSLSPRAVPGTTNLDYDVLQLIWTGEKLQQRLDVIDQRFDNSKKLALSFLKSGNKIIALRHTRELKLASQSREKCTTLLNRVEEVLRVITEAQDSKEVSEAIQIGARAIKENNLSVEEVQLRLQELEESIDSQKQVEKVLGSTPSYAGIEDEDIEEELEKLELEVGRESSGFLTPNVVVDSSVGKTGALERAESLSNALSNLKLTVNAAMESVKQVPPESLDKNVHRDLELEA